MQTPEEMNTLANKAKNNPEALLLLWQGCSRYACKIAMRYRNAAELNGAVDADDLGQCAFLGFYEAVQDFDPLRGDFLTLLSYAVRKACADALGLRGRERKEHYNTISIDAPVSGADDLTLADTIADETASTPFARTEMLQDIEKALGKLPDDSAAVIRLYDLQGKTAEETAKECQCSVYHVYKLRRIGFQRIRAQRSLREYKPIPFRHKTLAAFKLDRTSVVEDIVIRRLDAYGNL